jgi:hypothetical protein
MSVEQRWRRWLEGVSSPAPEPELHSHAEDPLYHEDKDLGLIYEGRSFFLESLDGSKVAVIPDTPGTRPASSVTLPSSKRKRATCLPVSNLLSPPPKGRRSQCLRRETAPQERAQPEVQEAPAEVPVTGGSAPSITR